MCATSTATATWTCSSSISESGPLPRRGGRQVHRRDRGGRPAAGGRPRTAAWADLDGDGWDDLILDARVYRNDGGTTFADYTDRTNLGQLANLSAILLADYDRDGKLDLYLTRTGPPGNLSWLQGQQRRRQGQPALSAISATGSSRT